MKTATKHMNWLRHLALTLIAVCAASFAQAATLDEARAALARGDHTTAARIYSALAERGDAEAQFYLGALHAQGRGVPQDDTQAVRWFRLAAVQGNAKGQFILGAMYADGLGVPRNDAQAVRWYRLAAEQGDAYAQSNLGRMYANGRGVPRNDAQAVHWYRLAAEQGNASAQFNLGFMYANGRGVPSNDAQAVRWYRLAAEQGNAYAQVILGWMYADGRGVPRNDAQTVRWFRLAAEQGDAIAQSNLGNMYANGRGVPRNDAQAVRWYRLAAEQGDAIAQSNLGYMYLQGRGVPRNDAQAVRWYRLAAEQGFANAQAGLGGMYVLGQGVPRNDQQAYFWLLLAAAQGNTAAVSVRDQIEPRLTAQQRAAAQAQARDWRPGTALLAQAPATAATDARTASPAAAPRGSGFRVAPGRIVTNAHVVAGCAQIMVGGQRATALAADTANDLALIALPGDRGAVAPLRPTAARLGESVTIAGFPLEGLLAGLSVTSGNVSRLTGLGGDTGQLQISAPVQPGNSGSPVLDASGQVIGVVVSNLDAVGVARATGDIPQNVNFAIKGGVLRAFLDAHAVGYSTSTGTQPLAAEAIATRARQFTVMVQCAR